MLLRSSSTPVLGSLLPSYSDSPNNNSYHYETNTTIKHPPNIIHPNHHKLSSLHPTGSLKLSSCSSSPISPSIADLDRNKGFRRAQSEGNLEELAYISCNSNEDQFCEMNLPKKFLGRHMCSMLQTIPSFQGGREEDEEESDLEDDEERTELEENEELLERIMAVEAQTSNSENKTKNMNLTEVNAKNESWNLGFGDVELLGQEMFLARGLGIGGGGGGGGGGSGGGSGGGREFNSAGSGGDGGDNPDVEGHYKKLVEENPGNPLFLRNYAQFLYQTKRDLQGAEENYSRAILADPKDGEILSQYAKLVWELHHDQDRASSYFERAVQASPEDSHVQAAYANFLWESEDYEDGCDVSKDLEAMPPHFHAAVASASA